MYIAILLNGFALVKSATAFIFFASWGWSNLPFLKRRFFLLHRFDTQWAARPMSSKSKIWSIFRTTCLHPCYIGVRSACLFCTFYNRLVYCVCCPFCLPVCTFYNRLVYRICCPCCLPVCAFYNHLVYRLCGTLCSPVCVFYNRLVYRLCCPFCLPIFICAFYNRLVYRLCFGLLV